MKCIASAVFCGRMQPTTGVCWVSPHLPRSAHAVVSTCAWQDSFTQTGFSPPGVLRLNASAQPFRPFPPPTLRWRQRQQRHRQRPLHTVSAPVTVPVSVSVPVPASVSGLYRKLGALRAAIQPVRLECVGQVRHDPGQPGKETAMVLELPQTQPWSPKLLFQVHSEASWRVQRSQIPRQWSWSPLRNSSAGGARGKVQHARRWPRTSGATNTCLC